MENLTVHLGERSYELVFGPDVRAAVGKQVSALLAQGRKIAVITDRQVAQAQAAWLDSALANVPRLAVEAGEASKSLPVFGSALDFLAENKIDRGGVVVAFGGGVIGDLAGYAAASYLRGIDFIQVPTTLLAMVDSSVGGKTGINLRAGKNLVGAFHQPRAVYISTDLLRTLPAREFAAGMAEVIKYGLLGDAALFARLETQPLSAGNAELAGVIRTCCALKAKIVEADERETAKEGGRALLNLGHTFGHAIEQVTRYQVYLHGEAVALGLLAATTLSQRLGYIGSTELARIERLIAASQLPTKLREPLAIQALLEAMGRDKKVRAGLPRFVVLKKIGEAATQSGIEATHVEEAFRSIGAV